MPSSQLTVAPHNGAPCLHVDGTPQTGLAFWHKSIPAGKDEWQEFARCGVHLFQLDINCWADSSDWVVLCPRRTTRARLDRRPDARTTAQRSPTQIRPTWTATGWGTSATATETGMG